MLHSFHRIQKLPISIEKAWEFFSSPDNLKIITPDYMGFKVISSFVADKVYSGMIIAYKVRPVLNIPMTWVTEISHVNAPNYFVDEQRQGPYTLWHHKHFFKTIKNGTEVEDLVHYRLPLGFIGDLFHPLIVKPKLEGIFNYRYKKLEELFGKYEL